VVQPELRSSSACDYDQHPFAIGCGPRVFSRIKEAFALHETSEEAILNNNGAFARYFMSGKDPAKMDTFGKTSRVTLLFLSELL
jgi:hypothetical protein